MPKYIKADQFFYPHGVRRGGFLELVDGKFGKHVDKLPEGAKLLIILVIVLHLVWWILIFTDLVVLMLWIITSKEHFIQ